MSKIEEKEGIQKIEDNVPENHNQARYPQGVNDSCYLLWTLSKIVTIKIEIT